MATSREIIIKLIDEKKITGEEAVILLNDIIVSELCEAQKVLDLCKPKEPKLYDLKTNNTSWVINTLGNSTYDVAATSGSSI